MFLIRTAAWAASVESLSLGDQFRVKLDNEDHDVAANIEFLYKDFFNGEDDTDVPVAPILRTAEDILRTRSR